MRTWIIFGLSILSMISLTSFTEQPNKQSTSRNIQSDEITAVINKDTTEKELEDLTTFFAENGIELLIKKIEYNDQNEITSLSLTLKKGNSKSQYSSSSNQPISEIKLGYKDNGLYINNTGAFDIASWKGQSKIITQKMDLDSLMKKHNFAFDFDFDQDTDSLSFNGHFNIQKFKDQIMNSFSFEEDEDGNFFFNGQPMLPFHNRTHQKFRFIDNPDIEKLIIIDGKEANFETLNSLAKSDQLAEVDFLKSNTAVSIYGDKAKDGAIIAITKKK